MPNWIVQYCIIGLSFFYRDICVEHFIRKPVWIGGGVIDESLLSRRKYNNEKTSYTTMGFLVGGGGIIAALPRYERGVPKNTSTATSLPI